MPGVWDPFEHVARLRRRISRLFDEADAMRPVAYLSPRSWAPAVDIIQDTEHVTVELEVPGVGRQDLQVELRDGRLTVSGERLASLAELEGVCRRRESPVGRFERSFVLPVHVDADRIEAALSDGILTLRIPRRGSGSES